MKNLIKLILFIAYVISIFLTSNYIILAIVAVVNIFIGICLHIKFNGIAKIILNLMPFILFTAIINLLLDGLNSAILMTVRLVLVCNITYIFKYVMTPMQLANAIETFVYPLKIFKIKPTDISLIVCICIAFIPILTNELIQIKYALKSKGMAIVPKNYKYILQPFFYGVLKKTNDVSNALKAKGYMEL